MKIQTGSDAEIVDVVHARYRRRTTEYVVTVDYRCRSRATNERGDAFLRQDVVVVQRIDDHKVTIDGGDDDKEARRVDLDAFQSLVDALGDDVGVPAHRRCNHSVSGEGRKEYADSHH